MNLPSFIDHTLLKPSTTLADIKQLCEEAKQYQFAAVCLPPYFVKNASEYLKGTRIKIATVVGFPFGYSTLVSKTTEITEALNDGANEIDLVHNIAALKSGDWDFLEKEIKACTEWVHQSGKQIKIIVESGILSDDEIIRCCEIYAPLAIDFMKTSTGYAEKGASVHAVQLMRKYLPSTIAIKASGGIRSFAFAKELVDAGATRLGCSSSLAILEESKKTIQ